MSAKQKINRVEPLIRIRKLQLDHEAATLFQIKQEKNAAQRQLHENQRLYIEGVNQLNLVRQSNARAQQSVLESGLDFVKSKWYKSLKAFREIENKERAQLAMVLLARKNLKTMDTLKDRYVEQDNAAEKASERKQMDDVAIRMFNQDQSE